MMRSQLALLIFLVFPFAGATAVEGVNDRAIFRLPSQVFFHSDVMPMLRSLERFSCVYPKSSLALSANLSMSDTTKLNAPDLTKDLVEAIIRIEKMRREVEDQFQIDWNDFWLEIKGSRCLKNGPSGWSSYLKSLFLLEVFLNQKWANLNSIKRISEREIWVQKVQEKSKHHLFNYAQ